jgi:phosphoribosyl 1,2-cyclic phosphate phosphodiesterase
MEIIFMGTGTSHGVPMVLHPESKGCDLENSKNWRTRSSVHVKMGNTNIQVDAAPEFRLQCFHNKINAVDLFILTHDHADHILGMDDLRRFCFRKDSVALDIYSAPEFLKRVRDIYPYAITDKPESKGYPVFRLNEIQESLDVEGGTIQFTRLPHGSIDVIGLIFEEKDTGSKFTYYTDCKTVGEEQQCLAKGSDLVVLDGLRFESHRTHMSIPEAVLVAQKIGANKTYLTHMTFQVDYDKHNMELPEGIELAYDGLKIVL